MIPSATQILAGYAFIARRHGFAPDFNDEALYAALRVASELATAEADEPAALARCTWLVRLQAAPEVSRGAWPGSRTGRGTRPAR